MKITWLFVIIAIILVPIALTDSAALQEIAGKIDVDIKPGETKTFQWGLVSDSDTTTTLGLHTEGKGAEFLFLPKSVILDPHQIVYVQVNATIPNNYPGNVTLTPAMDATEFGQTGGATVINIQVKKFVTLVIAPNENPQFRIEQANATQHQAPTQPSEIQKNIVSAQKQTNSTQKGLTILASPSNAQNNPAQKTSSPFGGRCLIATAAFGSDLSPQVQFLRGFRDNHILLTGSGSSFMNVFNSWYYSFSPYVADYERQQPWLQQTVKTSIYPLLGILTISEKGFSAVQGDYGALIAGTIASSMIGAVYFWPFALSVKQVRVKKFNYKLAITMTILIFVAVLGAIFSENKYALMATTSLFVLTLVSIFSILMAKTLVKIKNYFVKKHL
jgi:peptide/nickel transport system substrate-binding protein